MDSKSSSGSVGGSVGGSGVKGRFGPRREPPKVDSTDIRPVPPAASPAPAPRPMPRPAPEMRPEVRPESRPEPRQDSRYDSRPDSRPDSRDGMRDGPREGMRDGPRDQRDDGGDGDDRGYGNDRYQGRNPYADRDAYRRGAKKRKRGMKGWGDGPGPSMSMRTGLSRIEMGLPSDEELEREAQELERAMRESPALGKDALSLGDLQRMTVEEVHAIATKEGLTEIDAVPKADLIFKILKARAMKQGIMIGEGTLEMMPDGFGFLRSSEQSFQPGPDDIYIAPGLIRKWGIRRGMTVKGVVRPPKESERYFALLKVDTINGKPPQKAHGLRLFEDLTPHHPEKRFVLETSPDEIECRVVDLVAPLGFGQRALIVAPPRTGKTVLLQKMAKAITRNYSDVKLIVLLVDERPEEVTDFKRNCSGPNIEVVASTFDEHSSRHVQVAEMVIEKAKRMVEFGEHVVIFLDSITRLARAYNNEAPHSGRIMSGGVDAQALQRPKKFFGAARAIDGGGSLTIIGTALVDTGSKMDEVIFEEFKGTGNSELHLDRKLVEKRVWPAIDVAASGTRREELLLDPKELELVYRLRKVLSDMNVVESMDLLKNRLKKVKTNAEFLMTMAMG